jgi:CUB domain
MMHQEHIFFGGLEDLDYMRDQFNHKFYNGDVNCDGNATGQAIAGINNIPIPTDLSYSCCIGSRNSILGISSDGVVGIDKADINNYRSVNADTFIFKQPSLNLNPFWHIELTKQFADIIKGIDEPNDNINNHSYKISSGELYYGLISYQSVNSPVRDYDYYKVNVLANGNLNLQVFGITTPVYSLEIKNAFGNSIYSINSNGKSYINTNVSVTSGLYYVVLSGIPTTSSYKYPYSFKCTFSAITSYCSTTNNLISSTGTFNDGSGINNYNNNSDCKWKIQPNGATSIKLNFTAFNVNNLGDTVYVYNGGTINSPLLGKWTGTTLPDTITSTGGIMLLRFLTDATNTAAGWTANYSSIVVPTYCNGETTLISPSGNFSDGSGATNYGNNAHCSWLISPPNAYSITLNFLHFNTSDSNDVVNVYDGNDNTSNLLGSFFGNIIPTSLASSSGAMFVEFITNDSLSTSGWDASYTSFIPYGGNGIVKYDYWFDNNYTTLFSTPTAPQNILQLNSTISTNNLLEGLHTFQIRFKDNNNLWSAVSSSFLYKSNQIPTGPAKYEYWVDNNYINSTTINITNTINLVVLNNLDVNDIGEGLHTFNIRFKPDGKKWSSIVSSFFYKTPPSINGVAKYQYWYDSNWQDTLTTNISSTNNFLLLDSLINTLPVGLHTLHIRFKINGVLWSSVTSTFFYKSSSQSNTNSNYQYWYDNNWQDTLTTNISSTNNFLLLDSLINTLSVGLHTLNIRFKINGGLWSSVISNFFYKEQPTTVVNNSIVRCVYWYDNNWQNPSLVYYNGQQNLSSIINTDAAELSVGMHRISMMFKDDRGLWSSVVSDSFNRAIITAPICPFNSKQFVSQAFLGNIANRQWQIDTGSGFINLTSNSNYVGVNTDTLQILNAPTSWYGNKYRCVVSNGSSTVNSQTFILKFFLIWNGSISTNWENSANWNCNSIPDGNVDVIINSGVPRFPQVNTIANCRSLTTQSGVSIIVSTGSTIFITH